MKPENPWAFPCTIKRNTSSDPLATPSAIEFPGMSLRDYFAGQALANQRISPAHVEFRYSPGGGGSYREQAIREATVKEAYAFADAMLAERQKGPSDAD